jgi:hypothetical protein
MAASSSGAALLVLTTYDTDADIVRAVEAGGDGVPAHGLVSRMRAPAVDAPTAREVEALAGAAPGLTNAEIGRQLFIGEAAPAPGVRQAGRRRPHPGGTGGGGARVGTRTGSIVGRLLNCS